MARSKYRSGWFTFEDGYCTWFAGLSATEEKREIQKHGKLISYQPD